MRAIYRAKGRPSDNPLILHICDMEMLPQLAREVPSAAVRLALEFLAGAADYGIAQDFPGAGCGFRRAGHGGDTIPRQPHCRELIRRCGKPVAAPSANLSGSPSPTTAQHCIDDLMGRVDAIVDGGICGVGLESTVISLAGEVPTVLRPGGITVEQLRRCWVMFRWIQR